MIDLSDVDYGKARQVLDKCDKYKDSPIWVGVYKRVVSGRRPSFDTWDRHYIYHFVRAALASEVTDDTLKVWFQPLPNIEGFN